jgi:hypothetical protein
MFPQIVVLIIAIGGASTAAPPREVPDDPYRAAPRVGGLPRAASAGFGVQVNVGAKGGNIAGDAANEPSIAVDPTAPNRMVIGWRQFDTVQSNFRQAGWGYSHDGGRTWTFPGVIEPGVFRSDPVLGCNDAGDFYYCSLRGDFSVQFFRSLDSGVSWGAPLSAFGGDKQWFSIDTTGGPGHGNIYMSWSTAAGCCGTNILTRSTDGGISFLQPVGIFGNPIWGQLESTVGGTLFVSGISTGEFLVVGASNAWNSQQSPVFDVGSFVELGGALDFQGGPNPGGLMGQANFTIDRSGGPTGGYLYLLCSVDPPGPDPMDVMFARSTNGGLSWDSPVRVNDDGEGNWQWFGTMSAGPSGRIDVVWNDTRNSGVENISELFYASSSDGGATWTANTALGPPWDSHVGWPNQNKIGDYYDMSSDLLGANLAYAATYNGEQDVYFLRIGEYDCNGNGVPDPDDILLPGADCNGNGIPDTCELSAGTASDGTRIGIRDGCDCPADLNGDGEVDVVDMLALLEAWGTDPGGPPDLDGDGDVSVTDFLQLLASWGGCP